ncbi:hypothetical protein NXS19_010446 [Fusarium pseudograminearum]|uniref:Uncharacterized protein n=1 Tax=Fusarium pseudograminearum (strain CS3096) TaxID=1028729 RepID=K3VEE3_FUSPC|nr:hypothetical protein FPSE_08857 [Fusarium pseudograminearum CS3096]EKJ70998.1 hypothetical protein FPSE_08857 [Fusarium pseudograminearum CS3096]KAF0640270.1 hypothetical protein FPSE5266_08857 [Fusarium pseudograminearum]QPC79857.1 hypothetical protein HYE68_010609 [Fusarium pseudograminearum]UZP42630.1 hypothetical protein NXS19_010446 [Fusarium pseudograminearum]
MAQTQTPTFINLPPPGSRPETPSEMPGTPTSTTTSLSALSTTAIKDGHRGHFPQGHFSRGHQHNPSTQSLEAERADRISRLAGLERVSTLRAPPQASAPGASSASPQTTPTSTTGFPPNYPSSQHLTPAYFDSNGQPMAITKMSTVGTASATESHVGDNDDARTAAGDRDEDMFSTDTNYREAGSVTSMGGYPDAMDEDLDGATARSVGGYDDRMSDDGSASLVGFGEGAGSTVSGPIYHRRAAPQAWGLERTNSGLSDIRRDRETHVGGDTPVSASALQERRDARMMDGVAMDPNPGQATENDSFVDTTSRGPVSASQSQAQTAAAQEAAERIVQRLDRGETRAPASGLVGPGRGDEPLGKFYFEGEKRED